jgi:hypothetical protein
MKRFIVAVVVCLFVAAVFGSCKSKDCPAYSQVDIENVEVNS